MASQSDAEPFVTSFQGKTKITSSDFLKIFKYFDKDGNGYIEKAELDDFLMALGKESSKGALDEPEIAKMKDKILSKYDANYDGRLDLEELTKILPTEENFLVQFQHHNALTSVEFFKVWNHYDQDRSGFIESDELKGFLSDLLDREGQSLTPQRIDDYAMAMLDMYDKNKDGKLSLSEMCQILPLEENFLLKFGRSKGFSDEEFNEIWAKYDEDGNGYIADEELDALLHDLILKENSKKETCSKDIETNSKDIERFKVTIMECDVDRDGKINKQELKLFLAPPKK